MDCSPPGSSVDGILQAGVLEWVAMPSSRGSSWPRDQTCSSCVSCINRWILYHWVTRETPTLHLILTKRLRINYGVVVQSLSCVWLCNPIDCSTPDFPVLHRLPEFAQTYVYGLGGWCHPITSSKTGGSWWRGLTNRCSLEKEMANHSRILASRTP